MNFLSSWRWVIAASSSLIITNPSYGQTISTGYQELNGLNGGSSSYANGVSLDGNTVVGSVNDGAAGNASRAYRWTQTSGTVSLGALNGGSSSYGNAVSANGSVIVGYATDGASGNADRAYRWTQATGMTSLGVLNGGSSSYANAVSAKGNVIVGYATDGATGDAYRAYRWTQATGMTSLGVLNGGLYSTANAVSANGSVVVGWSNDAATGNAFHAYRWTQATGMTSLGFLNGGSDSVALGVSADGSVVVGYAIDGAAANSARAFRWTSSTGIESLGVLNGGSYSAARAVSADGQVVVGYATDGAAADARRAYRWSQAGGMQSVEQWLSAAGVSVNQGFKTFDATATNSNGSVVVGWLDNGHSFVARVTPQGSGSIDYPSYFGTVVDASRTALLGSQQADMVMHGLRGSALQSLPRVGAQTVWAGGGWGRRDHVTDDANLGSGEIGYARGMTDRLTLKMALGRTYSKQTLNYGGAATLQGTYALPELVYRLSENRVYATLGGYYNDGDIAVRRAYLNTGNPVQSSGEAGVRVSALRIRVDALDALHLGKTAISPYVGITYIHTRRAGYTEAGGGFPVRWDSLASSTTQARVGFDSLYPVNDRTSILGRIEGAYRLDASASNSTGEVVGVNSFDTGPVSNQRTSVRAAAGMETKLGPGVASFMLNGITGGNGAGLWAYANYRIAF